MPRARTSESVYAKLGCVRSAFSAISFSSPSTPCTSTCTQWGHVRRVVRQRRRLRQQLGTGGCAVRPARRASCSGPPAACCLLPADQRQWRPGTEAEQAAHAHWRPPALASEMRMRSSFCGSACLLGGRMATSLGTCGVLGGAAAAAPALLRLANGSGMRTAPRVRLPAPLCAGRLNTSCCACCCCLRDEGPGPAVGCARSTASPRHLHAACHRAWAGLGPWVDAMGVNWLNGRREPPPSHPPKR